MNGPGCVGQRNQKPGRLSPCASVLYRFSFSRHLVKTSKIVARNKPKSNFGLVGIEVLPLNDFHYHSFSLQPRSPRRWSHAGNLEKESTISEHTSEITLNSRCCSTIHTLSSNVMVARLGVPIECIKSTNFAQYTASVGLMRIRGCSRCWIRFATVSHLGTSTTGSR